MFWEFILFELKYRKARPTTYVYGMLILLLAFLTVVSPTSRLFGAAGQMKANAPYIISTLIITFSLVFSVITSAVMGVAITRDFDHNAEAMLFTAPIRKTEYLMGRFCGSLLILILINLAVVVGLIAGFAAGEYLPWETTWRGREMLPFDWWTYAQPFLLFTVLNAFSIGAIFFMSGALWRNSLVIYTQGIILLILYQVSSLLLGDLDLKHLGALLDPFGWQTFQFSTLYWTVEDQNSRLVPLEGDLLVNRAFWVVIGGLSLLMTHLAFSFRAVRESSQGWSTTNKEFTRPEFANVSPIPTVPPDRTSWKQLFSLATFHFRVVWSEVPFMAIVVSGLLLLLINAFKLNQISGTNAYATTHSILIMLNKSFNAFFIVIAIFYSAELIWKERALRINQIVDALPVRDGVSLFAKFVGLTLVFISLILILMMFGILVQVANQYYDFNLPLYFKNLFGQTLVNIVLITVLSFLIQVLVNNKFVGITIAVVVVVMNSIFIQVGVESSLLRFASGSLGEFSDMNMYGHFVEPYVWLKTYWLAFAGLMVSVIILFTRRGEDESLTSVTRIVRQRMNGRWYALTISSLAVFAAAGTFIYYNANIVNVFETEQDRQEHKAAYERTLQKFERVVQPRITEVNVRVELYPSERDFEVTGYYYLKNKSALPISDVHIQRHREHQLETEILAFDRPAAIRETYESFGYSVYQLATPLYPGDSLKMSFRMTFQTSGFQDGRTNTDIVYNGVFFNSSYFPSLGYNKNFRQNDTALRRKYGLVKIDPMSTDSLSLANNLFGDDADQVRFEAVVGTEAGQVAVAPGVLNKEWREGGRRYFHYRVDGLMANFYSILSARYAIKRDVWNDVDLEVFYHPDHQFNIERMVTAMKDALSYYTTNFGPYQFKQLRIVEFPRYSQFAQSFAGTIPFSEGLGFVMKVSDPKKDLDMVYYLTAHEVSHQWWGHQVMEADVQGGTMLSESLSQYSAMMVLRKTMAPEVLQRFMTYELDRYLAGRKTETRREQPLRFVEKQPYIHYNKGSLVFYALQDYIGEAQLNSALRNYLNEWSRHSGRYPTSQHLIEEIRKVTPDSLSYIIDDLFESITLFENKAVSVFYEETERGEYEVTIRTSSTKWRMDSLGRQVAIPLADWIDIGVYGQDSERNVRLMYLKKHRVTEGENEFVVRVNGRPMRAGIDPLRKLIDRHVEDNTMEARKAIELGNLSIE